MYSDDFAPSISGIMGIFYLVYMLVMMAVSVGSYVFQSLGFYTIAKRRGIRNPWLSWIPVGSSWILGCISDQYQYVAKGKIKNKRKALLVLELVAMAASVALMVMYAVAIVGIIGSRAGDIGAEVEAAVLGSLLGMIPLALAVFGLSVAAGVIQYIALYDLYSSCDPRNNVMYLVLNIFVGITLPIFIFICRNKDLGMPPRKMQPAAEIPEQPVWEPAQPPEEPWNHPEED